MLLLLVIFVSGLSWNVTVEHVERVKWYGPHIRHLVVDVKCRAT